MAFRKRNVAIAKPGIPTSQTPIPEKIAPIPGIRPSPLDGRPTTSTGIRSLDSILAGHAGLPLGTSLLLEESGTTDFGGTLLKYYAAEGVLQGHHIHILGMHQGWGRELPGLGAAEGSSSRKDAESKAADDKMKIAWRYERLGEFGASGARERNAGQPNANSSDPPSIFCHDFDLSKRLIAPSSTQMHFIPTILRPDFEFADTTKETKSPFTLFLQHLSTQLSRTPPTTIHRIIIPSLLSPALYPSHASLPHHILPFLHALRALLRQHPTRLTLMITLPLPLHPRTSALTKWIELLSDGVLEIAPFPSISIIPKATPSSSSNPAQEEPPKEC
ncbi:Elongator subunit elp4 [Ciborinia camelliae]|nr:Elongator subunit elp4 [Ciborinia camelliae]